MIIKTNPKAVFKEICVWESVSSESKTQSLNPEEPVRATQTVITLFERAVLHCNTTEDPLNSWLPTSTRLLELQSFIRETSPRPRTNKQQPNGSLRYKWQRPMRSSSVWGRERERWRQRDQQEAAGGGKGDDLKVDEESSWNCRWCWMHQVSTTDSPPPRFFFLFLDQSFVVAILILIRLGILKNIFQDLPCHTSTKFSRCKAQLECVTDLMSLVMRSVTVSIVYLMVYKSRQSKSIPCLLV